MRGLTNAEFEGRGSSTLRYWFDWWRDPSRRQDGPDEKGRDPAVEAARILAELEARHADGQLKNPPGGLHDAMRMEIGFFPR